LNIAGGNGKTAEADRRRYFEIARGSASACAAIQDVLIVGKALEEAESQRRKRELDRMAAMLSRLGGRGDQAGEQPVLLTAVRKTISIPIPIPIAIAISIWRSASPDQRVQATRNRSRLTREVENISAKSTPKNDVVVTANQHPHSNLKTPYFRTLF
jgi:hypothetical protein